MPPKTLAAPGRGAAKGGYRCSDCGATAARWVGRCRECQAWGTLTEAVTATQTSGLRAGMTAGAVTTAARPVAQIDLRSASHVPTGIGELDRVLGGGLVPGSVVLLAGEPGVGKSTLLLAVAAASARAGRRALVVTGEESAAQVRLRAERTGCVHDELWLAAETDLAAVVAHIDQVQPALLIVDSVQTVASSDIEGSAGGVTQVREVSAALTRLAKERNLATVLVGHVTKEGALAGPRVLEHLVDVVLHAEGDRHSTLRMVRVVKNRYGAADEVGCFEQDDTGLREVPDPSGLFLSRATTPVPGTCVTITIEGRRALPTEVQALLCKVPDNTPVRRVVSGLDSPRIQLLIAVVATRLKVSLASLDVYLSTVGGVRVTEPAADLAVALALVSAHRDKALPVGLVAMGEVALSGEVRRVPGIGRRLAEAARMGFATAIVPTDPGPLPPGLPRSLRVIEVSNVAEAALAAQCGPDRGANRSRPAVAVGE